jgi:hypothetical protein
MGLPLNQVTELKIYILYLIITGHWIRYNDKFLGEYSSGSNKYDTLEEAQSECLQRTGENYVKFPFPKSLIIKLVIDRV